MKWLDKAKSQVPVYDHDWFDKQDALFNARVESFEARGIIEYEAKCLALKLYLRDYDNLSECHCFECQHLKGLPFFECVKGKPLNQDPEVLHKCIGFIPLQYGETK